MYYGCETDIAPWLHALNTEEETTIEVVQKEYSEKEQFLADLKEKEALEKETKAVVIRPEVMDVEI